MIAHVWGDPFWGILVAAAWVTVLVLIAFGVAALLRGDGPRTTSSSALRLLEERYARGEIDRDEFLERRAVLTGAGPTPDRGEEPTQSL